VKKTIILTSIILVIVVSIIPFNTTLVPEWKLRVIDENGAPYKQLGLRQFCYSYTLGISPCHDSKDFMRETDENGYALFPERKINASLLSRAVRTVFHFVMQIAHGSFGESVYVDATGPQGYKTLKYFRDEPLPTEFVLPSKDASAANKSAN
jgi:hypothetical protein